MPGQFCLAFHIKKLKEFKLDYNLAWFFFRANNNRFCLWLL